MMRVSDAFHSDLPAVPSHTPRALARLVCAVAMLWLAGCSVDGEPALGLDTGPLEAAETGERTSAEQALHARAAVVRKESGVRDLPGIRRAGELRILVQRESSAWLPRSGSPLDAERDRARALAADLDVEARFVPIDSFEGLIPALLAGDGDLVAENLTVTEERRALASFSVPTALVRDQVVARLDDEGVSRPKDLDGRRLHVQRSSSFWETAQALGKEHPGLEVVAADESLDVDGLLDQVESGAFDLTMMDSNVMDAALHWRTGLRVAFELPRDRMIAWAMRGSSTELRRAVDGFLTASGRRGDDAGRSLDTSDLPGITERGVLRVITRNNATCYFISRGQLVGFEYDLVRKFAADLGLRLEIIVPSSHSDLDDWLRQGKGDLIAAGLTIDADRAEGEGISFSRDYLPVREVVVARAGEPMPTSIDELSGRTFAVRRSSAYWRTLHALQKGGASFEVLAAPENMETEEIIDRVAEGAYDLTLADDNILAVTRTWRDDVDAAFAIGEERGHGWVTRSDNPELLAAVNAYFDREYRGLYYNITRKKYFGNPKAMRARIDARPKGGSLSPYDDLVNRHAAATGFDWRLVTAQMYQESRFDPNAVSFAGARGLLQVMPRTARDLGFEKLEDPETGIRAGLAYMRWVRDRFKQSVPEAERLWFGLAAYNVGFGHVRDAQRIASARGLESDRWFDNVEQAMLLKERPEVHRETRFGYARGREPVAYVRDIRSRYQAYVQADHAVTTRQ